MAPVILVTGGAGYIGSSVMRRLGQRGMAIDDLSNSERPLHAPGRFFELDIRDASSSLLQGVSGIIHCAGSISPRESCHRPDHYWRNNVVAAFEFFSGVKLGMPVVFSSSCAVYGRPMAVPVSEYMPTVPISPYGRTKLAVEQMLADMDFKLTCLRYFNPAGGRESHKDEIHLIPRAVLAAIRGEPFGVMGDGRQVRDFVHVEDLAEAHVRALEVPGTFNLGSGTGHTILEVLALVEKVVGKKLVVVHTDPHPADPEVLVADTTLARKHLGWAPKRNLEQMVAETFEHFRSRP
jgi:UDP-glucose 4-epimerase